MTQPQKTVARPAISQNDESRNRMELQIEVALNVTEMLGPLRQESEMVGTGMSPKEEAAYAAALDRLERYLDIEF